jgi:hypothetical protein
MPFIMKFLPGLIAALAAYIALKVLGFLGVASLEVEILVFFIVYAIVAVIADKAMIAYGMRDQ